MHADRDSLRRALGLILAAWLLLPGSASAQGWLDRLLEYVGIAASPGALKSDRDAPSAGDIWVVDLAGGGPRQVTHEGGYVWPIFAADDAAVLALRGEVLMRIPLDGGAPQPVLEVTGIRKLVGFNRQDGDKVLILTRDRDRPLRTLSLSRKTWEPLPYDAVDAAQRRMLRHLEGQERVYGEVRLYVRMETKEAMEGVRTWSEVYVARGGDAPRKLTACAGDICGQPSLSTSGTSVAYVRAPAP